MACGVRLDELTNAASENRRGVRAVGRRSRNGGSARPGVADNCGGPSHAGGGIPLGPPGARSLEGRVHGLSGSAREGGVQMATKWRKRIAKAVSHAMMERDRVEVRAMDALLSVIETPRRR